MEKEIKKLIQDFSERIWSSNLSEDFKILLDKFSYSVYSHNEIETFTLKWGDTVIWDSEDKISAVWNEELQKFDKDLAEIILISLKKKQKQMDKLHKVLGGK